MFFFIDLDDLFDGVSSTFGLIVMGLLTLLFVGLPIAFFERGGLGVILALVFGLTLSIILLSLFCIITACKTMFDKKTAPEYKKKKFAKIYLIAFIVLSLLSLLLPSNLVISNYHFTISKIIYFFTIPLITDVFYVFCIYADFRGKNYRLGHRISSFFVEPLKKLLSSLIIPTFVFYWIVLLFYLGACDASKIHDFYNSVIDKSTLIFEYKNTTYDKIRNGKNVETFIEDYIGYVSLNKIYSTDDLYMDSGEFPKLFWQNNTDIRYYTYSFICSKAKVDNYFKERGILIKNSNTIDENTIYLEYHDLSTLREYVVKFDLQNFKIIEKATYFELDNQFYINNKKRLGN